MPRSSETAPKTKWRPWKCAQITGGGRKVVWGLPPSFIPIYRFQTRAGAVRSLVGRSKDWIHLQRSHNLGSEPDCGELSFNCWPGWFRKGISSFSHYRFDGSRSCCCTRLHWSIRYFQSEYLNDISSMVVTLIILRNGISCLSVTLAVAQRYVEWNTCDLSWAYADRLFRRTSLS